jgi:hypothetical protein
MKTPPKAKVQKVCRTKGSGSSLQQMQFSHYATDPGKMLSCPLSKRDQWRAEKPMLGQRGKKLVDSDTAASWREGSISPTSASSQILIQ